eukprot:6187823-Pleurochrysis_carterae.AAC.3
MIECVAQLERCHHVGVVAVAIANIACGTTKTDGADEFDGQSLAVGNFDAHVGAALRHAAGRKYARLRSPLAVRTEPLSMSATQEPPMV